MKSNYLIWKVYVSEDCVSVGYVISVTMFEHCDADEWESDTRI